MPQPMKGRHMAWGGLTTLEDLVIGFYSFLEIGWTRESPRLLELESTSLWGKAEDNAQGKAQLSKQMKPK